ncbi:FmdB family zinc ribbon protein [Luedemannella helvata]|uniref:Putative regulatory protein FmdB zinc ribbon domain-containing protein n=1 Tax=Luedemannella helvata TaxID=349315 RepID=A0ABP4VRI8_9ACTN
MPTYQYACTACGHQLEAVQSFSDEPLSVCPACEGKLRKLFNSVGIVFKGSGFYRTDSRSGAKDSTGGTTPAPAQKSESAAKETKPATTAASSTSTPAATTTSSAPAKA